MNEIIDEVIEKLTPVSLKTCEAGEVVEIAWKRPGALYSIGRVQLIKIKLLTRGQIQIKYKNYFDPTVVFKANIPPEARIYRVN